MKFPSLLRQGWPARFVPKTLLLPSNGNRHYNAAIAEDPSGEGYVMAYRLHTDEKMPKARCTIAICDVDANGLPLPDGTHHIVDLPGRKNREHHEDPRLFQHKGALWLSYIAAAGYEGDWRCGIRLVKLAWSTTQKKWVVDRELPLHYGYNDREREKNWVFFSWCDRLFFVYKLSPHIVVEIDDRTGDVLEEWVTPGIQNWPDGTLSGSTPPLLWRGRWLSVFHSATLHPSRTRRYSASAYQFSLEPPFEVLQVTRPLFYGSEFDGFLTDPRELNHEPAVAFPCGAVRQGEELLVSCGYNDHGIAHVRLGLESLAWVAPVFPVRPFRYFWTSEGALSLRGGYGDRRILADWIWTRPVDGYWQGVLATQDPWVAQLALENEEAKEITRTEFARHLLEAEAPENYLGRSDERISIRPLASPAVA